MARDSSQHKLTNTNTNVWEQEQTQKQKPNAIDNGRRPKTYVNTKTTTEMENKNLGHKKWLLESRLLFATDKSVWYGVILQSGGMTHWTWCTHTHINPAIQKREEEKKFNNNNSTIRVYATQNGIKREN